MGFVVREARTKRREAEDAMRVQAGEELRTSARDSFRRQRQHTWPLQPCTQLPACAPFVAYR